MTEIFNRRPLGPVRAIAALAALTTVGAILPLVTSTLGAASAATSCAAPTNLSPNAGTPGTAPELKGVVLNWNAPSDAPVGTKYDLEFSPNQDYTTNLTLSPTTTSTRFVVPVMALPHGSYFWRVRVDGRSCWSDDSGSSAEFTSGWRNRPVLTFPAAGQTVDAADLRYSWNPMANASSYLLQVVDSSGADQGSCVTQGTTFSPYDVPTDAQTEAERVTKNAGCTLGSLANGVYGWRVLGLDDTAVTDHIAPYVGAYGDSRGPEALTAHDASKLTALASDISAPSEQGQFTVAGAPTTATTMNVKASLVGPDGNFDANCDVADSATACSNTPTIRWTAIDQATAYRVTVATDQHFTNNVRVYDTASTSVTPIDQLLDSQAGQAYYVRVCSNADVCSAADSDTPQTGQGTPAASVASFRKRETPVTGLKASADTNLTADAAQVTLSWSDTSVANPLGSPTADFEVQVSSSCDYSALGTSYTTDATEQTDVFGAGSHFWRVRAVDASGSPGPWSDGNADTPVCGANAQHFTVTEPASSGSGNVSGVGGITTSAAAITYETGNSLVRKSGKWVTRGAHGASHGSALVTDGKKKQALTLFFQRRSVTVDYCGGPMDGYFSVYLDGKLVRKINSYKAYTSCGKTFILGKLSTSRSHKLVVQASNKKGSRHGTPQVVIDYFKAV